MHTDPKELTWAHLRANKLANLETLILAITHEINNALSVIKLETEVLPKKSLHTKIDDVCRLIRSLQILARPEEAETIPCNWNDYLEKALKLCQPIFKNRLTVKLILDKNLSNFKAYPFDLLQINTDILLKIAATHSGNHEPPLLISTQQLNNDILVLFHDIYITLPNLEATKQILNKYQGTVEFINNNLAIKLPNISI